MIVIYRTRNEILICQKRDEKKMMREWFNEGGRLADNYDRFESNGVVKITNFIKPEVYEN